MLSGDYAERGRWYTLFTHVFLCSELGQLASDMILFSVFFRAAWVAGFGRLGTPVLVVGSGVAGGLAFLHAHDPAETAAGWGGTGAVTSGLMMAATVARPRMPFFVGFTPAALPLWAVSLPAFLPDLVRWYRDPRKMAQARREHLDQHGVMRDRYQHLLAARAAELRKQQAPREPNMEKKPDPPREVRPQDGNKPPTHGGTTHREEARREEETASGEDSSVKKDSSDANTSSEERLPDKEDSPRSDDASIHKTESPGGQIAGSETGPPREEDSGSEERPAPEEESPDTTEQTGKEEPPNKAAPPASDTLAQQRRKNIWKDATPHSWLVAEAEQPGEVAYTRVEPHIGGAACGAVVGLVLRLMLRR